MKDTYRFKILTLNCWGVPTRLACKLRKERISAIGETLHKSDFDIVVLQEIWNQDDYKTLCNLINETLLYKHYFYGGMFGTGVCIFSKYKIMETMTWRYTLNGSFYAIHHGDWFGGKGVGIAKLQIGDFRLYVYGTHLHAAYSDTDDEYKMCRLSQAFELSEFVRNTSAGCDGYIVCGDFNYSCGQRGYEIIRANGRLKDAWLTQMNKPDNDSEGMTCDKPDNTFCSDKKTVPCRIDFIMYGNNAGVDLKCKQCFVTMRQIPKRDYYYSDHEGVCAEFDLCGNVTMLATPACSMEELRNILEPSIDLCKKTEEEIEKKKSALVYLWLFCVLYLFTIYYFSIGKMSWMPISMFIALSRFIGSVSACILPWFFLVVCNFELCSLLNVKLNMRNLIQSVD